MMSAVVIHAERLSKRYTIGRRRRPATARDALTGAALRFGRALRRGRFDRETGDEIWALEDVSFDIRAGEIVGVIGRNGAGKSTLLKILSQITEPTSGFVDVTGRIGSLLEVGTGFHEDLTGRENTYLNGAILGMRKAEIDRKFDEIVAFAEIDRFIDTPVKHYSSGMYMRLAFAVAAHLETEILVVDEVLAVGDAQFQKKCLGKIDNVARGGRTVLFVTHNMAIVQRLASTAILLDRGRLVSSGPVRAIVAEYLAGAAGARYEATTRTGQPQFLSAELVGAGGAPMAAPLNTDRFGFRLRYLLPDRWPGIKVGIGLLAADGTTIFTANTGDVGLELSGHPQEYEATVLLPPESLLAGDYHIAICIWDRGRIYDLHEPALSFAVEPGPSVLYAEHERKGFVHVPCTWTVAPAVAPLAVGARR
jgi:lipopolysaccharide transport system ATP-binding protein